MTKLNEQRLRSASYLSSNDLEKLLAEKKQEELNCLLARKNELEA